MQLMFYSQITCRYIHIQTYVNMTREFNSRQITGLVIPVLGETGESASNLRPAGFKPTAFDR